MRRQRVGVLISGRGSNMQALVEAARDPNYPAEVVYVLSNRADAGGIDFARRVNIPCKVIDHKGFSTREEFDAAVNAALQDQALDIICCAGFMRIMTPFLIAPWAGRMLNIHPSLLPKYKGLHTHQRAIDAGDKEHGCTVHLVTPELDDGPIVAQAATAIEASDTAESLQTKVLALEHPLYVKALAEFAAKFG